MEMKKTKNVVKVSIEEDLTEQVSGFGRYQMWQCLLAVIPIIFTAVSNTNFVFAAATVNYRCAVPQCEMENLTNHMTTTSTPIWWPPNVTDVRCSRPVFSENSTCSSDDFEDVERCDKWIYETRDSIVTEFGLACQEWKRTLVGTVHNVGVLVSMPLMGFISDRWGRRNAIILSGLCLGVSALKTLTGTGAKAYIVYIFIEFVEAVLVTGTYTTCFVLMVELIGTEKRTLAAAGVGIAVAFGELLLDFIVWNIPYWRHFLLIVSSPAPIFIVYALVLEESIRWLLTNGKNDEALKLLHKIANRNHFAVSDKAIDEINKEAKKTTNEITATEKFNLKLLFSSPTLLKRVIICCWWWFSAAFVYYGLLINAVDLPGNKYINFALTALITIPGDIMAVIALDRAGRKKTLLGGFVFCGICCVSNGFIPQDYKIASITVFLIGKMSISACFNSVYVYTSELVPTSARGSLMGVCSMVARIGAILAPLTPLLSAWWHSLPTALFGCASLSAAVLALATPETLRKPLPDTVAEASAIS